MIDEVNVGDRFMLPPRVTGFKVFVKVKKLKEHGFVKGRIVIPDSVRPTTSRLACVGEILMMGPEAFNNKITTAGNCAEPWAKVGDTVVFTPNDGWEWPHSNGLYRMINDEDIVGPYQEKED